MSQLVRLRGDIEKTAADRKKIAAEQALASGITTVKILMIPPGASQLPAIFPEPYIGPPPDNDDTNPANDAGFRTNIPQATPDPLPLQWWRLEELIPWSTIPGSPERYRKIRVDIMDAANSDLGPRFANSATPPDYARTPTTARIKKANTATAGGVTVVSNLEVELSTPDPRKPAKQLTSLVRFDVPPPPAPSCTLTLAGNEAVLRVSGVASRAQIQGSNGQVLATLAPSNSVASNSVYGQDLEILRANIASILPQTTIGSPGQITITGTVAGPQGQSATCDMVSLTTVQLGINFEDLRDGGDMDFNDAVFCFKGAFRYTGDYVESAMNQDVKINVTNRSGCNHQINVKVTEQSGQPVAGKSWQFNSRGQPPFVVNMELGQRLFVSMDPLPCKHDVTSRKIGDRIVGGPNNGRYGVQLLKDVCNTSGN